MARRAANEGTIRERKDRRWEARALLTGPDGRRRRRSILGRTQEEARAKLRAALAAEATGAPMPPARLTLGRHLDDWLAVVTPTLRPSTRRSYEGIVRMHLKPALGHHRLAQLTPQHVQAFLAAKSASGLAARTVAYIRAVLRQALVQAERWGLVTRNVARLAQPPRTSHREVRPLDSAQARHLLDVVRDDRLGSLFVTARATGCRQGELLGLSWHDSDLEAAQLTIRHALQRVEGEFVLVEPKSATSRRVLPLSELAVQALHAQRARQLRDRLLAADRWRDDPRNLAFTSTVGTPLDGIAVTRRLQSILASAGLPRQRFHDLRHLYATILLSEGVSPRVVMELLGHSQISLTLNTYSHVVPALTRDAVGRIDRALGNM